MTFPFFEVLSYEDDQPVRIVVWHVRSVRQVKEMAVDDALLTRIEFSNGDTLYSPEPVQHVLEAIYAALQPVEDWLAKGR
jgi:hypothetical protein